MMQDGGYGFEHKGQIEPNGAPFKVLELQTLSFARGVGNVAAAMDAPVTDKPRAYGQKDRGLVGKKGAVDFPLSDRSRANDGELARKNVEQLGKFVDGGGTKEDTELRYPRIVIDFSVFQPLLHLFLVEIFLCIGFRIGIHRTEFQDPYRFPVFANATVREERLSFGRNGRGNGDNQEKREQNRDAEERDDDVKKSFDEKIKNRNVPYVRAKIASTGQRAVWRLNFLSFRFFHPFARRTLLLTSSKGNGRWEGEVPEP